MRNEIGWYTVAGRRQEAGRQAGRKAGRNVGREAERQVGNVNGEGDR